MADLVNSNQFSPYLTQTWNSNLLEIQFHYLNSFFYHISGFLSIVFNSLWIMPVWVLWTRVYLHDPDFFLQSIKDLVVPRCKFIVNPGEILVANIEATYYELLDRPSQKCNNDKGYSFTICVEVEL